MFSGTEGQTGSASLCKLFLLLYTQQTYVDQHSVKGRICFIVTLYCRIEEKPIPVIQNFPLIPGDNVY